MPRSGARLTIFVVLRGIAVPAAVVDKYKAAATVVDRTLQALIAKAVAGANLLELCAEGDRLLEEGTGALYNKVKGLPKGQLLNPCRFPASIELFSPSSLDLVLFRSPRPRAAQLAWSDSVTYSVLIPVFKCTGIAFPTCLSLNATLQNLSPLASDDAATTLLAPNDLLKICLGAHIDGYAVIAAETIVVSPTDSPVTDVRASLLAAAHQAAEVAIRMVKPGGKNWEVTEGIKKVLAEYESVGIKGIEGVLSHQVSSRFSYLASLCGNLSCRKSVVLIRHRTFAA